MDKLLVWCWRNTRQINRWFWWFIWTFLLLAVSTFIMINEETNREFFMPGPSIDGHYQIQERCDLCHDALGGVRQKKCLSCHEAELKKVNDSHGRKKFRDPRIAADIDKINVRKCRVCHIDHKLANVNKMGVTIASDFCIHCHRDIDKERPTHKDLTFDSCVNCHNYHDNTGLTEAYLTKHLDEPATLAKPMVYTRDYRAYYNRNQDKNLTALKAGEHDTAAEYSNKHYLVELWVKSTHAKAGVNCGDCHRGGENKSWTRFPSIENCKSCHARELKSFKQSRHGMRVAQKLTPMSVGAARIPMHVDKKHPSLNCNSCHKAHDYSTKQSAVEACMTCHNDEHTKMYKFSRHYQLVVDELSGKGVKGSGVTCATCHLPRETITEHGVSYVVVQHNQNATLRPNSKQINAVCSKCHGLSFTLNALADEALIERNFNGLPSKHLASLEMVKARIKQKTRQNEGMK